MELVPRLTVCVPCFGRPERTKRLAKQIAEQDLDRFEVFFLGDHCKKFDALIESGFFTELKGQLKQGQRISAINFKTHYGGFGYNARNFIREIAVSPYVIFVDNDDCIEPNHFSNYLSAIEHTSFDMVYFDTFIEPTKSVRKSELVNGKIGHAEIIVNIGSLRRAALQQPEYGHDWQLITSIIGLGAYIEKSNNQPTYKVMGVGELRELGID